MLSPRLGRAVGALEVMLHLCSLHKIGEEFLKTIRYPAVGWKPAGGRFPFSNLIYLLRASLLVRSFVESEIRRLFALMSHRPTRRDVSLCSQAKRIEDTGLLDYTSPS